MISITEVSFDTNPGNEIPYIALVKIWRGANFAPC
jgi:hypothetical protein